MSELPPARWAAARIRVAAALIDVRCGRPDLADQMEQEARKLVPPQTEEKQ